MRCNLFQIDTQHIDPHKLLTQQHIKRRLFLRNPPRILIDIPPFLRRESLRFIRILLLPHLLHTILLINNLNRIIQFLDFTQKITGQTDLTLFNFLLFLIDDLLVYNLELEWLLADLELK